MIGTIWGAAIVGAVVSLAWLGWRRGGPVAVLVVLTLHALSQGHHVDDAGIVYAFAENLAAGHGLVPQPGAPVVEGVSDPLWLALLVPGAFFGEVSAWASLLQAGLMIFVILGVGRLASRVVGPDDPRAAVGVAQLATATSGVVFAWTTAGLEGALMAALLVGVAWAAVARAGVLVLAGVMLCAWVRPEGAVAGLGVALAGIALHKDWKAVVYPAVGAAVGLFFLHGVRFGLLGTLAPTSALAKLGTPSWRYVLAGLVYAGTASVLAGLPALVLGWVRTDAPRRWLLPVILALGTGLLLAVASGGDWMRHGRYLTPYLPVVFALGVPPLVAGWREHPLCRVGLVLAVATGVGVAVDAAWRPTVPVDHGLRRGALYAEVGRSACGETSVATPDIGGVIWRYPQVRVLDFAGLIDQDAAERRHAPGYWPDRLAAERPAVLDLHDSWAARTGLDDAVLEQLGYRILARREGVSEVGDPTLWIRADCAGALSPVAEAMVGQWSRVGSGAAWELGSKGAGSGDTTGP